MDRFWIKRPIKYSLFFLVAFAWAIPSVFSQNLEALKNKSLDELYNTRAIPIVIPRGVLVDENGGKKLERIYYYTFLYRTLARVLRVDDVNRVFQGIFHPNKIIGKIEVDFTEIEQALRANRISNFESFMSTYWSYLLNFRNPNKMKMEPWGALAVLHFYRWLGEKTSQPMTQPNLFRLTPYLKGRGSDIHLFVKLIALPDLPNRSHSARAPKPTYDKKAWDFLFEPFHSSYFEKEFRIVRIAMLAVLTNYQAGHNASAQMHELRERFYDELRSFYLEDPRNHFKASKDLLLLHFANSGSDRLLMDIRSAGKKRFQTRADKKTLAFFIRSLKAWNSNSIRKFVLSGDIPNTMQGVNSKILRHLIAYFHKNPVSLTKGACESSI